MIRGRDIVLRPIRWGRFSQLLRWFALLTVLWMVSSCGGGEKEPYRIVLAGSDGLYSVAVDGAGLARLADVPDDRLPSLSPDASRIVWLCGEGPDSYDVCISNLDGTDQRNLIDGRVGLSRPWRFGPVWLRDGSRVAFVAYNYLHFVNVDGTELTRVYEKVYGPLTPGALSSDGKRILDQRQANGQFEVFVTDLEDTSEVKLADIAHPFYPLQAWSPEGDKVVFVDEEDQRTLHLADMQAGTLDSVSADAQIDLDVVPAWSPDGNRLAFAAQELPGSSIFTVNADGTDLRRIADADLVPRMGPPHSAVMWSPDGQQVFYLGHSETCGAGGCTPGFLHVVNSDGTGEMRLTGALAYGILGFQGQPE